MVLGTCAAAPVVSTPNKNNMALKIIACDRRPSCTTVQLHHEARQSGPDVSNGRRWVHETSEIGENRHGVLTDVSQAE